MDCGRCQISSVVIKAFVFLLCNYGQAILLEYASLASEPIDFMISAKKGKNQPNLLKLSLVYSLENWGILGDSEIR